jgi:hypothetical protein
MAANPRIVEPPFYDQPLRDNSGVGQQQFSHAWTEYHQSVADRLMALHAGVVDGSDAEVGDIGEHRTAGASIGMGGLATNVPIDVVALSLPAGDWDVRGSVQFGTSAGLTGVQAWIGLAPATLDASGASAIFLQGGTTLIADGTQLQAGPVRVTLSGTVNVYLGGLARFTTGAASAGGTISARRMR